MPRLARRERVWAAFSRKYSAQSATPQPRISACFSSYWRLYVEQRCRLRSAPKQGVKLCSGLEIWFDWGLRSPQAPLFLQVLPLPSPKARPPRRR